jgi:hypothetical protein
MKPFVRSVLAFAAFALGTESAFAAPITTIDFQTGLGGPGGTVTIGANITGTDIFIDTVTITGALFNNGVFDVEGAGVCADGAGGCGLLSFDKNLNTIALVGSIPDLGIASPINLLTGDLSGGVTVAINNGSLGSVYASGNDSKSRDLLMAIGLDPATQFALFGFATGFNANQQGSPYTAISTDITNTSVPGGGGTGQTLVPEPGSLMLFGSGLVACASRFRRRYPNKG